MNQCLIIDNSSVVRKVAKCILNSIGYEVVEAGDGQEALELCKSRMPDVIIVDRDLPRVHGQEFLETMTRSSRGGKPFIVYTTIENDPLDLARAIKSGADAYILKPYTRVDLLNIFGRASTAA